MCEPTTTTMMYMSLATSIASAGIQYQQQKAYWKLENKMFAPQTKGCLIPITKQLKVSKPTLI